MTQLDRLEALLKAGLTKEIMESVPDLIRVARAHDRLREAGFQLLLLAYGKKGTDAWIKARQELAVALGARDQALSSLFAEVES